LIGNPPWPARQALERLDEQAAILATLLRGEPIEHPGPFYPTSVQEMPQPVTRPRPPLAAHGPMGIRETRRLLEQTEEACVEVRHDSGTLALTVLAYLPEPDPFSSLDAFDHYVGSYEEIGISAITFYWPPIDEQLEDRMPTPDVEVRFERICGERIGCQR
jgi:hypothetical protein